MSSPLELGPELPLLVVGCRIHAASVLQTMHMLLHYGGLKQNGIVDGIASLACYIAAAVHDFEHGGVNNDFLMRTKDPLAITYNDVSPLVRPRLQMRSMRSLELCRTCRIGPDRLLTSKVLFLWPSPAMPASFPRLGAQTLGHPNEKHFCSTAVV